MEDNQKFVEYCRFGQLEQAQELYSQGNVFLRFKSHLAFRTCCQYKIYEQKLNSVIMDEIRNVSNRKYNETINYLISLEKYYKVSFLDDGVLKWWGFGETINQKFVKYCRFGQLEQAQELYSQGSVNVHFRGDKAFRRCCQNADNVRISYPRYYSRYINTMKWLSTLDRSYKLTIYDDKYHVWRIEKKKNINRCNGKKCKNFAKSKGPLLRQTYCKSCFTKNIRK